uniref:uncharacterized protein LOC122599882 n=1 Tax=Erigeron canadensis TaxID=72917 RepID=UPI001CB9787D|nr:uncharacterized protein LOC122599882 [Erigeron canadensis]
MAGKGNPHHKQPREKEVVVVVASSASSHNHRKSQKTTSNQTAATTTTTPQHQKPSPSNPPSQSNNPKPSPSSKPLKPSPQIPNPNPNPNSLPENFPPPPTYGFHMLDRRTILLADGTARTYLALPPDYQDFPPRPPVRPLGPESWPGLLDRQFRQDHWNSVGLDGSRKRKFGVGDENEMMGDEFARQRQQLLQYGNMGLSLNAASNVAGSSSRNEFMMMRGGKYNEIDQGKLKTAFMNFVRVVNENANQKKKYLADGKQGPLQCLACGRSSKDFPDMHSLIMHTYNPEKATSDQVPDHLGLHKALCILMGWNYLMPPDNSRAYQRLSAEEADADRDDLIMWPPHVIIHNTATGKSRDGRMEGLGNKAMDAKLIGLGFTTGKSKAMYGREGHLGVTAVKFSGDQSGLRDAMKLADFFQKQKHGRGSWSSVQSMCRPGKDDEKDPNFVKLDKKTGEKERILYGYLGTVFDLDTVDFDTRKKVTIESRREKGHPI